jgi:hypothetical protein
VGGSKISYVLEQDEQLEVEDGEGYLYPLPICSRCCVERLNYPAKRGAEYPAHLDYPTVCRIIWPNLRPFIWVTPSEVLSEKSRGGLLSPWTKSPANNPAPI